MIYLVRHGMDDESFVGGHSDISLTKEGIEEVNLLGQYIKDNLQIDKIYTSDVKRAVDTALIINCYLNLDLELDHNLRELNKGLLTGRKRSSLTKEELHNLETKDVYEKIMGGESMYDLYCRVKELYESGYFESLDNSLIVTHRGFINMLYFILNNEELSMDKKKYGVSHGSIHEFDQKNKVVRKVR